MPRLWHLRHWHPYSIEDIQNTVASKHYWGLSPTMCREREREREVTLLKLLGLKGNIKHLHFKGNNGFPRV